MVFPRRTSEPNLWPNLEVVKAVGKPDEVFREDASSERLNERPSSERPWLWVEKRSNGRNWVKGPKQPVTCEIYDPRTIPTETPRRLQSQFHREEGTKSRPENDSSCVGQPAIKLGLGPCPSVANDSFARDAFRFTCQSENSSWLLWLRLLVQKPCGPFQNRELTKRRV